MLLLGGILLLLLACFPDMIYEIAKTEKAILPANLPNGIESMFVLLGLLAPWQDWWGLLYFLWGKVCLVKEKFRYEMPVL